MCRKSNITHVPFLRAMAICVILTGSPLLSGQSIYQLEFPCSKDPYAGAAFHTLLYHQAASLKTRLLPTSVFTSDNRL
ncbi:MAG TPA: hypothetical protein VJ951_12275, partial [Bacteroidales bacterium]|nr:hypothetical protein [Bacteroidales bacterium]